MTTFHYLLRNALCCFFIVDLLGCSSAGESQEEEKASSPNIIFILADDLGWADLPVYGNAFNEAPNITKMADEGMKFTNAYAACPVCSPTRASIMSGQYPARVGITDFITGHWRPYEKVRVPVNRTQYLPLDIYTVGEAMQDAGYATGYFGKWHLGGTEHFPQAQGFDKSVVFRGGKYFDVGESLIPHQDVPADIPLSNVLTDLSLDFMEENKDKPFFLFLSHYDVHVQLDADSLLIQKYLKKEKVDKYPGNAIYASMVEHVDQSVGKVMEKIDALNISDNTLVVFFSDNGGLVKRFDEIPLVADSKKYVYEGDSLQYIASSNAPLRGEKGMLYEGGIREPLIVKYPGKVEAGSVSAVPVTSVDFLPTFVELAGGKLPDSQVFDGESMVPLLRGEQYDAHRPVFWHYPHYHHSVPAGAVRQGDYKLIEFYDDGHVELYNLKEDIAEQHNLAGEMPDKAHELGQLLAEWRESAGAEMPVPNPDFDQERRYEWGTHPDRAR